MSERRILSLWFPRLAAERCLRQEGFLPHAPFAVVREESNTQVLASLSAEAEAAGLSRGQPLRDARAVCPKLVTSFANPQLDAAFLELLRRWAGKFSPWVCEEPPESLVIDLTGCAHLFGGEAALIDAIETDCAALGLTALAGIADTVGAAWALARFAGQGRDVTARTGDDIMQEARATRSRAARRHWVKGGVPESARAAGNRVGRIAAVGQMRTALAPLPVAALRLPPDVLATLTRLGLRHIGDLSGQPRAALARRFGRHLVQRLDQAIGVEPEAVNPARPPVHFVTRLTLPDPIGREDDIAAALDRLLPPFGDKLRTAGQGARRVRMECFRTDHTMQCVDIGLARPSADPDRIRPLLLMKIASIDAGFGIDCIRVAASVTEPLNADQHSGHVDAAADGTRRQDKSTGMDDLLGRLGARTELEAITRLHPAESHVPEKTAKIMAAVWSEPANAWPRPPAARPIEIWKSEMVTTTEDQLDVPAIFRWRGREFEMLTAIGPERIAGEWWLDDPDWRTGVRDYWRVTTRNGERLWLYYAYGGKVSEGWFCQGRFG